MLKKKLNFFLFLLRSRYADVCRKTELGEIDCNRFSYFSNKMRKKIYGFSTVQTKRPHRPPPEKTLKSAHPEAQILLYSFIVEP